MLDASARIHLLLSAVNRTRLTLVLAVLIVIAAAALLLGRCTRQTVPPDRATTGSGTASANTPAAPQKQTPDAPDVPEVLTSATLSAPAKVPAGSAFEVKWTGPANREDYIAIASAETPPQASISSVTLRKENPVTLTAPMAPGSYQLRYIAIRSRKVLGTAEIEVTPVTATLSAAAEAVAGAPVSIEWTGPGNSGDYITIVPKDLPDERYGNNTEVRLGSPLTVTAPVTAGPAEIRYRSGQGGKVLARRELNLVAAAVTLLAPAEVIAGSEVSIEWTGPKNAGDYITIVPKDLPDDRYGNNTEVRLGSPLTVTAPIAAGPAEIRYKSGQGGKVLARRELNLVAATVTLSAPAEVIAGSEVSIEWTGPKNAGDYITIVPKDLPDGRYGNNTEVRRGSPLTVPAPIAPGVCEIRYMSGQGSRVLGRRDIQVVAAAITLEAVDQVVVGADVSITWTGPANAGDYLTIVPKGTPDGRYGSNSETPRRSPLVVAAPIEPGAAEIRYMSGQGSRVLARRAITLLPARITLEAPASARRGSAVSIGWTGPAHRGDYLTIVPAGAKEGTYKNTAYANRGSPVQVQALDAAGPAEIRYISGQGSKTLAARPIEITSD